MHVDSLYHTIVGGLFVCISYLLGGIDNMLIALGIFMCIDYATGLMVAGYRHNIKSKTSLRGLYKKTTMLLMIIVATQIDIIDGMNNGFLRNAMVSLLIANEGLSIIENAGKLGVKIPLALRDAFALFKSDSTIDEKDNKKNNNK